MYLGYENAVCDDTNSGQELWCPADTYDERPGLADFYSLSYVYLGALGLITTVLVGSTISYIVFKMYGEVSKVPARHPRQKCEEVTPLGNCKSRETVLNELGTVSVCFTIGM